MRTGQRRLDLSASIVAFLALNLPLLISNGCAAPPEQTKRTTHAYPAPYVEGTAEIMRRDASVARSRELVRAGKSPAEAHRIAEKEFPPAVNSFTSMESAEYYRWKQQQVAQTKFESELDKLKREP